MRWLLEILKALAANLHSVAAVNPQAARGIYFVMLAFAVVAAGLTAINPDKYWWTRYVLIGGIVGFVVLVLIGLLALAGEIAAGSGTMGGRTGVMLQDLDAPPPEAGRKKKPAVRRKGGTVPDWKLRPKAEAALALLEFLSDADRAFAHAALVRWIEETAVRVRGAIEAGDLAPVAGRLTPVGRKELQARLDELSAARARQMYGKVVPLDVRPVLVDAPADASRHAVTALLTLKSSDYLAEARTRKAREGNKDERVVVQEFWTFRRDGKKWRLDRIRPAADADELLDVLNELAADRYVAFARTAPREVLEHITPVEN